MRIGVPKEPGEGEKRVALIPDTVASLAGKEIDVVLETGAGVLAGHPDSAYEEAGATIGTADDAYGADIVLRVNPPSTEEIARVGNGKILVGFLAPLTSGETTKALADGGVTSFAIELIPRITRAQAMDGLSSQANIAGYASVLLAARECGRLFPMMTTAAGTVSPARVMVLGAGVAGLQAIATAKRLGAVVSGFDIRRAAWEQIASLGGRPLELDFIPDAEDEGGYARPLTEEENEKVREALAANAGKQDVIITTAQIPGRPAPTLITKEGVENMSPGSVIIDLAGDSGGNCELTEAGRDRRPQRRQGDRRAEPDLGHGRPRLAAVRQEPRELHRPDHRGGRAEDRLLRRGRRRRLPDARGRRSQRARSRCRRRRGEAARGARRT